MRVRGRPAGVADAAVHHTIRCAISTNAGATTASSAMQGSSSNRTAPAECGEVNGPLCTVCVWPAGTSVSRMSSTSRREPHG